MQKDVYLPQVFETMLQIRVYLFSFFLLSIVHFLQAQELVRVRGQVIDFEGKPIIGVNIVAAEAPEKGATTDANGYFTLMVSRNDKKLLFSHIGYEQKTMDIALENQSDVYLTNIQLFPKEWTIEGIDIHASAIQDNTETKSILTQENIIAQQGLSLAQMLQQMSGVSNLQTGSSIGKPVIHGLHSNRLLILQNGVRQEGQQWGLDHAPEIDLQTAGKIWVLKGAGAVRYGADAIAGVVLVEPAPIRLAPLNGYIATTTMSNGRQQQVAVGLEGQRKQFSWRVQSNGKYGGNVHTPNYYLANTGIREWNLSSQMRYESKKWHIELFYSRFATEIGIFSGAHIGNLSDLQGVIARGTPFIIKDFDYQLENPRQKVTHDLLKVSFAKHQSFELTYAFQYNKRQEFDIRRAGRSEIPALDMQLFTHSIEAAWKIKNIASGDLQMGVQLQNQQNSNIAGTGVKPLIPNYSTINIGAFALLRQLYSRWQWEAGLRYDYKMAQVLRFNASGEIENAHFLFDNFSASAGLMYVGAQKWTISTHLTTAWRPPAMNELFSEGLHHGVAAIELGDATLKSEKSYQWHIDFQMQWGRLSLETNAFLQYIDDFIFLQPLNEPILSVRGAFPSFAYRATRALLYGADVSANWQINKDFSLQTQMSLLQAKDLKNEKFLPLMPSNRYTAALHYEKKLGKALQFHTYYNATWVDKQYLVNETEDYMPPPEAYWLMEAGAGFTHQKYTINLTVYNLTNNIYREYMNRFRYYADEMGRNYVLRLYYKF
ncbi:MAG: TonB-dependent receptor [Cytophagales bacterium]|nr:MAG: TonB-dependent receptor [Cytophagales bacterium]